MKERDVLGRGGGDWEMGEELHIYISIYLYRYLEKETIMTMMT